MISDLLRSTAADLRRDLAGSDLEATRQGIVAAGGDPRDACATALGILSYRVRQVLCAIGHIEADAKKMEHVAELVFDGGRLTEDSDKFVRELSNSQKAELQTLIEEWYGEWLDAQAAPELVEDDIPY
jgi:hypothetical protein